MPRRSPDLDAATLIRAATNYDALVAKHDLQEPSQGLLVHTAGFDHDAGVLRIFDVWEARADGERFITEKLEPVIEELAAAAADRGEDFEPPTRQSWYELHDSMAG